MNALPPSLDRFESQLEEAIRRRRAARPRRLAVRTAVLTAAAAAVTLGVLGALPASGPSVVARAAAALTPSTGSILHVVVIGTVTGPAGHTISMRDETWQSSSPPYDMRELVVAGGAQFEVARANGRLQLYDAATNTIYVGEGKPKETIQRTKVAKAAGKVVPAGTGADVKAGGEIAVGADRYRAKILGLLRSGKAHEDGRVTVDGRDAIRIVSDDGSLALAVDADTYRPIEWRVEESGTSAVARFPTYEELPATPTSAGLLSLVAQHPGARVDSDSGDFRAAQQRLAPPKPGS